MKIGDKVKRAVIPAAGLGTRFLPATKSVPKEMLPIVDRPILLYVVEEAIRAGIEDIVIIAGRGKNEIEDFFDHTYELEDKLAKDGKEDLLRLIRQISEMVNIISVRQKQPLGLGHAVYCSRGVVGDSPFAVLLGDEIMMSGPNEKSVTEQLVEIFAEKMVSTVAVMEVDLPEVVKYGIVDAVECGHGLFKIRSVVEKPTVDQAPSQLALPGRYLFTSKIFEYLRETKPGRNGEIQLTDAMTELARGEGLMGTTFSAQRFDAGDKFGYIQANIELALMHPEIGPRVHQYLTQRFSKGSS